MVITDFTAEHLVDAERIGRQNYETEREYFPALPADPDWPDLRYFAENGMGIAALEDGQLIGFLCGTEPFEHAFRSTDAVGVFSPMGANGALPEHDGECYARMYQAAGEKWARAGAASHAICLYAHDTAAQRKMFEYGFGLRSLDGIRDMSEPEAVDFPGYLFSELPKAEWHKLLPLDHMLDTHMAASPCFILRPSRSEASFEEQAEEDGSRFFVARVEETREIVAFLKAAHDGETFVCEIPRYLHVNGAFCLPSHRGKGIYTALLRFAIRELQRDGITRLGVDFESINPTAHRFWRKHFGIYTHSVTRRIDEHAVTALHSSKQ